MKKFTVLLVVVALTLISSIALAEISVSGSIDTRSRNFYNTAANPSTSAARSADTQTRVRLVVDGKAGDVAKARIQLENDWDTWGRLEETQGGATSNLCEDPISGNVGVCDGVTYTDAISIDGGRIKLREAWVDLALPVVDVHLVGGHQLLQLGHGWWFRSMKYGSDAWLAYKGIGNLTLALVNVKASEGSSSAADDIDAYVVVGAYKISDTMKAGVDVTTVHARQVGADPLELMNISGNFTGKIGPVNLKAQVDFQQGDDAAAIWNPGTKVKFSGVQLVAQADIALDPVTVNATFAMATGDDPATGDENEEYQTLMDADPHYAFLYEYKVNTAAEAQLTQALGSVAHSAHTGFANTVALGAGASFKVSPSLSLAANLWLLKASEEASIKGGTPSDDIGTEIDVKIGWKLADNVAWNWSLGMFQPGDAYNTGTTAADDITGIQGILSVKF